MHNNKPSKSGTHIDTATWDAMKAAGFSEAELEADQPEGPMIYAYTRRMAIDDGVLVDLSAAPMGDLCRQAGYTIPLAMTATAFAQTVKSEGEPLPAGQDETGRLWDVLMVLRAAIRKLPDGEDRCFFDVSVWDGQKHNTVKLWCQCGPGDEGEPVLTIMSLGED